MVGYQVRQYWQMLVTITLLFKLQTVKGDALTFSNVSGPSWLSIADYGFISGTPSASDVS
ncbi:MAG: hypothetical protein HRT53_12080 [Colwellia sp.]|nr:hypothetical protein [Colwellia sp.]